MCRENCKRARNQKVLGSNPGRILRIFSLSTNFTSGEGGKWYQILDLKRVILAMLESPGRNQKLIKLLCTMCIIPISYY